MKGTVSLAAAARLKSQAARAEAAAKKAEEAECAALARNERTERERAALPSHIEKVKSAIVVAAERGDDSTKHFVMINEKEEKPDWAVWLAEQLSEELTGEGFTVEQVFEEDLPFGSDPLYPYVTYNLWLTIKW